MKALDEGACRAFLGTHRVGLMALARDDEAYAIPLFYAYDGAALYFNSHHGEKEAFLDRPGRGCFVVLEVHGDDQWTSVQARGHVERVASNADAERAFKAISENPFPPEFGVDGSGNPRRSSKGTFLWMMRPDVLSGRSSRPPVAHKA